MSVMLFNRQIRGRPGQGIRTRTRLIARVEARLQRRLDLSDARTEAELVAAMPRRLAARPTDLGVEVYTKSAERRGRAAHLLLPNCLPMT